jgi:hypothetical protein
MSTINEDSKKGIMSRGATTTEEEKEFAPPSGRRGFRERVCCPHGMEKSSFGG